MPLARIPSSHSPNKLKTLKRSMFGKRTVCNGLPRLFLTLNVQTCALDPTLSR
jgi:hypothetical protein